MNKGAGILFLSSKGTALFLKRSELASDFPGFWDFPGGSREGDESAQDCAVRETAEEIGFVPTGELYFHTRTAGSAPKGVAGVGSSPVYLPVSGGDPAAPVGLDTVHLEEAPAAEPLPPVDYTTFILRVDEEFEPTLNGEHDGWAWAPVTSPPQPMHPGCQVALDRIPMNELGVARAIADGRLASPQRYENVWLFAIRITGTDLAFRPKGEEFVVRPPEHYLNGEFLARCNGLPVIWKHPKKSLLNGDEFKARVVGTVFLPYVAGAEVWAVAKIFVDEVAEMMAEGGLSTSPGVNFADWSVNRKLTLHLADGSKEKILHEGDPSLLDHIAVCELGVWDKGEPPSGIRSEAREDSAMADKDDEKAKEDAARKDAEEKEKAAADKAKKDADEKEAKEKEEKEKADAARKDADAGKTPDDKLSHVMDAMSTIADAVKGIGDRMDSFGKRMDAFETMDSRKDSGKKDGDDDDDKKKEEAEKAAADKAKKDAAKKDEDDKEKERADKARKDSVEAKLGDISTQIERVKGMIPKDLTDDDYVAITDAQSRADDVFIEHGGRAPRPLQGQTVMAYDRFVATKLQDLSPTWKGKNLKAIADDAFPIVRDQIYAEARQAAMNPTDLRADELRMVERKVDGHTTRVFHGQPKSWMNQFAGPVQLKGEGVFKHQHLGQARG